MPIITNFPQMPRGGGKNLLTGTRNFFGDGWYEIGGGTTWQEDTEKYLGLKVLKHNREYTGYIQEFPVSVGETYTFSAYVKADGGTVVNVSASWGDGVHALSSPGGVRVTLNTEWKRYSITFTITKEGQLGPRVEKPGDYKTDGIMFYVCGYKLERGAVSNPIWTPNPDDAFLEIDALNERIKILEEK